MERPEDPEIPSGLPEDSQAEGVEAQPLGVAADPDEQEGGLPGIPEGGEPPSSG